MKKFTLFISMIICATFFANSQAFKYPMFEHFTQASCSPCAAQNPGFQATILDPNPNTVRHIAYHTSWPGVDPMYNYNKSESDARVSYYGVSGVPDIFLEGNYKEAQPGGMTMDDVNFIIAETSPIKITVSDVDNGSSHDVTVKVISVGVPPTGTFVLRTAIIERNVNYTNPPGSNGEKYFPNVFRKMLPSTDGDPITLAAQGGTVTFNYTYNEDAAWKQSEIGLVSFVQKSTKEVINCGASFDNVVDAIVTPPSVLAVKGTMGNANTFDFSTGNSGAVSEDFIYTLTSDAPADWAATFSVNGSLYSNSGTVTIPSNTSYNTSISVTPGATPKFAQYTLTIQSAANPNVPAMIINVYVISGVTDLVVNAGGGLGDGTGGGPADWQNYFDAGLSNAGSTTYDIAAFTKAMQGFKDAALADIKYIYYNIGWTFPAYNDELIGYFEDHLDNGGRLFISGQDAGWDAFTSVANSGHSTPAQKSFYSDYLNTDWLDDGSSANSKLTANIDDIYSALPSVTITKYYGNTYFYPDQIDVLGTAIPIFYYNSLTSKISGTRFTDGNYKTVYLGVGLEMVGADADKNSLMKTTYDWFHGNISGIEFDANMAAMMGQNFPNPADAFTNIPINKISGDATLIVTNALGQIVLNEKISNGSSMIKINTGSLPQGIYQYRLSNEVLAHSLQIVH